MRLKGIALQAWTGDSVVALHVSLHEYVRLTGDRSLLDGYEDEVRRLTEGLCGVVRSGMLLLGGGWMDAMSNYVGKQCLTNQLLLYRALKLSGRNVEALTLKQRIDSIFWNPEKGYYVDVAGGDRLDALGNSLAILYGLASKEKTVSIAENLKEKSGRHGILNLDRPYPRKVCGQTPHIYQNSTIWPLVQGHVISALAEAGFHEAAQIEFRKLASLPNLNEWYTPEGEPMGSPNQLWTAAQTIIAYQKLL